MRRITRVAGVVLLVSVAVAVAASPTPAEAEDLALVPASEDSVVIRDGGQGEAGRTWGYWGRFTGSKTGSYKATCSWLAASHWGTDPNPNNRDHRLFCTIVFAFRKQAGDPAHSDGGSLVAQGLVKLPGANGKLFARRSWRKLAITGGTAPYVGRQGFVDRRGADGKIVITLVPPPT
jgi:hypothetical protein